VRNMIRRHRLPQGANWTLPPAERGLGRFRVTFLGVSTLLFDDGETAFLTDGFFTRPGRMRTLIGLIAPNHSVIRECLELAGVDALAAVVVTHSHYDHVMDAPSRIVVPEDHEPLTFGKFTLRLVRSEHIPPDRFAGDITEPIIPPVRVNAYRMGHCYSLLVEHSGRAILTQGSAGFRQGALAGYRAEVVYLGIGTLGIRPQEYQAKYWQETVGTVGGRRVMPIHWDDFWRPLSRPLIPLPSLVDDFDGSLAFLRERADRAGVDLRMPTAWQPTDPFTDLPSTA
jgi:L-ascorbate metabolism protein UlaG (beta-lactamase superfamily)